MFFYDSSCDCATKATQWPRQRASVVFARTCNASGVRAQYPQHRGARRVFSGRKRPCRTPLIIMRVV